MWCPKISVMQQQLPPSASTRAHKRTATSAKIDRHSIAIIIISWAIELTNRTSVHDRQSTLCRDSKQQHMHKSLRLNAFLVKNGVQLRLGLCRTWRLKPQKSSSFSCLCCALPRYCTCKARQWLLIVNWLRKNVHEWELVGDVQPNGKAYKARNEQDQRPNVTCCFRERICLVN